jgi:hypothetical protein
MAKRILATLLVVFAIGALQPTPAHAARMRGAAYSDSGPIVPVVIRVRDRGTTLVGAVRCKGSCLSRRYRLYAFVAANGIFSGTLTSRRSECTVGGTFYGDALEGRYYCQRNDGAVDSGSFYVER